MPTVQELRERAKREQEKRRLNQQYGSTSQPFATDGFFESTQYYNTPADSGSRNDSGGSISDSGSCSTDSSSF